MSKKQQALVTLAELREKIADAFGNLPLDLDQTLQNIRNYIYYKDEKPDQTGKS